MSALAARGTGLPRLLAAAVFLGVFGWGLFALWPSERRAVERRFSRLLELCEKSGGESPLDTAARLRGFLDFWAPGFVASAQPYEGTLTDPQQLAMAVARYRSSAERIRISTSKERVEVESASATASMDVVVTVDGLRGGDWGRERFRARLSWRKLEGSWKIEEARILEVLDSTGLLF